MKLLSSQLKCFAEAISPVGECPVSSRGARWVRTAGAAEGSLVWQQKTRVCAFLCQVLHQHTVTGSLVLPLMSGAVPPAVVAAHLREMCPSSPLDLLHSAQAGTGEGASETIQQSCCKHKEVKWHPYFICST